MKHKQKFYTSKVWNPETKNFDYYQIPMPEEEVTPDFSGIADGTKVLVGFAVVVFLIGHITGVI